VCSSWFVKKNECPRITLIWLQKQLSPRSLRKHLQASVKFVSLLTTQSRPSSPSRKTAADQRHPDQDRNTPSPSLVVPPPSPMLGSHRPKKWLPKWPSHRQQKNPVLLWLWTDLTQLFSYCNSEKLKRTKQIWGLAEFCLRCRHVKDIVAVRCPWQILFIAF